MLRNNLVPCVLAIAAAAAMTLLSSGQPARAAEGYLGWVSNFRDGTVSVIDLSTYQVVATHRVGRRPRGIDAVPGDALVAVANSASGTVSVVHASAGETELYDVGRKPYDVAIAPDSSGAIVTLYGSSDAVGVTADGVGAPLGVGRRPWGIAFDPDGDFVAIACSRGGGVEVVPTDDLPVPELSRATIATGTRPVSVAIDPRGKELAVIDPIDGTITMIDLKSMEVTERLQGDAGIWAGAYDPSRRTVAAVSNSATGELVVFTKQDTTRIGVGRKPMGVAYSPDGRLILVANHRSHTISVIDARSLTVVATVPVGRRPWDVAVTEREGA